MLDTATLQRLYRAWSGHWWRSVTRNSAVADKPHDAFVQMQWRGWINQRD